MPAQWWQLMLTYFAAQKSLYTKILSMNYLAGNQFEVTLETNDYQKIEYYKFDYNQQEGLVVLEQRVKKNND